MKRSRKSKKLALNLTAMADAIIAKFKIPCSKQAIVTWRKWHPPFPPPTDGNRYNEQDCFEWVEKNYLPKHAQSSTTPDLFIRREEAKSEREIDRARRERFETDKVIGLLVDRAEARQKAIGSIRQYHNIVVFELEKSLPDDCRDKLKSLNAPMEILAPFYEWFLMRSQATVDRIEQRCEIAAKEADAIGI